MRVKLEKIKIPWYAPREEYDEEFMSELAASMEKSGQWDDLIVRKNDQGEYELISGSQRLTAAKRLGWDEINAKLVDVSEQEAATMSLETNMLRKGLKEIEEGKAIKKMMDRYNLTQKQVAERLRRSTTWVSNRLSLALDIIPEVQKAMVDQKINISQAVIIASLDEEGQQKRFLKLIMTKEKDEGRSLSIDETRTLRTRFLNDSVYTIGYSGWDQEGFLRTLKDNKIKALVDVRDSGASTRKPEFNRKILEKAAKEAGIIFLDRSSLGVPYDIRTAAKEDGLSNQCFREWYLWHVTRRDGENRALNLAEEIKEIGRAVVMCACRYPKPKGDQNYHCHRDFLADILLNTDLFDKREDL